MACAAPLVTQADAFLAALAKVRSARVESDRLTLLDQHEAVLAVFGSQSQDVAGTTWTVTGYNNGKQAVVSILAGTMLRMAFGVNGSLSGSAGCNTFVASYTAMDEDLTIGPAAVSRKTCARPEQIMEQEAAFLVAMGQAARSRIEGERLELRSSAGALLVSATRSAGRAASGKPRGPAVLPSGESVPTAQGANSGGLRLPATLLRPAGRRLSSDPPPLESVARPDVTAAAASGLAKA
jgi:heat shock protein HslJ